jgi:hypothetical protein
LQRALLLHVPERRGRWFWHVVFYISLTASILVLAIVPLQTERAILVISSIPWLLLAVLSRTLAVRTTRRGGIPPGQLRGFRSWFLLYVPSRRVLWLTHACFYLCLLTVVEGVREIATGEFRTTPEAFAAVPVLYFALGALVSRGVSVGMDARGQGMPRPAAWLRLGLQPRTWNRRLLFWVGALLFYASVFMLPLVLFMTVLEATAAFALRVLVPLVVVGSAARWMVSVTRGRPEPEAEHLAV